LKSQNILDYSKGDHHGKSSQQKKSFRQSQGSKRVPDRLHWLSLGYQESREGEESFQKFRQKPEAIIYFASPLHYTDPNKHTLYIKSLKGDLND
jgi:hypothetical protein